MSNSAPMEQLQTILDFHLFTVADQAVTVGRVGLAALILVGGVLFARWLERLLVRRLEQNGVNADVVHLVQRGYLSLIITILFLTTLDLLDVPLTAFAFVTGAVAIGVGFGAQNIINNFISGWILMWERPIRIGDFLELAEAKGTVESINTRSTRIRRIDGVHMLVPNSQLLENMVINWTLVDNLVRSTVRVGVAYGSPVRRVEALIQQAVTEHADILDEPKPLIVFEDFGDSALVFDAYFWVLTTGERDLRIIRSDVRFRLIELFADNGITVAFPQRDIHIDSLTPVQVKLIDEREVRHGN